MRTSLIYYDIANLRKRNNLHWRTGVLEINLFPKYNFPFSAFASSYTKYNVIRVFSD